MITMDTRTQRLFRDAVVKRAVALFHQGEVRGAEIVLDKVAENSGGDSFVQHMRGLVAAQLGHHERAQELLAVAVNLNPADPIAHTNLGVLLLKTKLYSAAAAAFEAALSLQPQHVNALKGISEALVELGMFDLAVDAYRDAVTCAPDDTRSQADLAALLSDMGNTEEALDRLDDALSRDHERADLHTTLAFCLFKANRWSSAWSEYEWRRQDPLYREPPSMTDTPEWRGEDLAGKTILLQAEQGLGDTIQFVRYAPLVKAKGCRVLLQAPKALLPLLTNAKGIDQLVTDDDPPPACDFYVPLMSLPGRFDTAIATVPAEIPYLSADEALIAAWRQRLALKPGLAIGIAWQGNPDHPFDRWRSMPLSAMRPLFDCPGAQFVSLQFGAGQEQLKAIDASITAPVAEHEITSFADTAAIIANLDLVISVDSAVAHLAGALGKPVWILLAARCDWRWMRERDDTPWYPQTRLFRQETLRDWPGVIARVRKALWAFAGVELPIDATAPPQRGGDAILADALFMQGTRHYGANEIERAKKTFERALTFDPDHVNTLCNLAALEQSSGNRERTMALLQRAIQLSPHHPAVRSVLGDELLALEPTDDTIALCQHMLQIMPDSAKVHAAYALALKNTGGDLDRAMTHFKRAVELDQRQPATFYQALGETLIARGNLEGAEISLQHALALDPRLVSAHCAIAETYLAQSRLDDAATSFRAAIDIDPDDINAIRGLERVEAHRPDHDDAALAVTGCASDGRTAEDRPDVR